MSDLRQWNERFNEGAATLINVVLMLTVKSLLLLLLVKEISYSSGVKELSREKDLCTSVS